MGKLNIAHHKSYHPYRRDNIEKVRQDEEEARLKEAKEEGRMMLADSEARIDRLRERAGTKQSSKKGKEREKEITTGGTAQPASLPTTAGHINFFEDLEHNAISSAILTTKKKTDPTETEKGFPLAPSAKDLKPWYSERITDKDGDGEVIDEKRKRDLARQSMHDPLTSITHQLALASRTSSSTSTLPTTNKYRPRPQPTASPTIPPEIHARLTRELSERERALDLIRRRKREMGGRGSETPSSLHGGGGMDGGYGDVFNRREVEEAHRGRERRRERGWGDNERGDRDRRW